MSGGGAPGGARPIATAAGLRARLAAPPSKSLTQRALVIASLARGVSIVRRPLLGDDGRHLARALQEVGIGVAVLGRGDETVAQVDGAPGARPKGLPTLFVGNAGTAMRFLAARLAVEETPVVLDGDERMRRRPIGDLLAALEALGAAAESLRGDGCPPVRVGGRGLRGGQARLAGALSSQYLSALLMAAPRAERDVVVEIEGALASRPYVDLTIDMMRRFGVVVERSPEGAAARRFAVRAGQSYRAADVTIEGDWSSASYLFAAAAVAPGRVEVMGLDASSPQGDRRILDVLEAMGCRVTTAGGAVAVEGPAGLRGLEVDLGETPDLAPTVAAVALFASGSTRITGVPHLRHKESDRIAVLCEAIAGLGGEACPEADGLGVHPRTLRGGTVDPHHDHRIAMAFAIAGLRLPGVSILDPACVTKSYPGFWDDLDRLVAAAP